MINLAFVWVVKKLKPNPKSTKGFLVETMFVNEVKLTVFMKFLI